MKRFWHPFIACIVGLLLVVSFSVAHSASSTYEKSYLGGEVKFKIDKTNVDKYKDKLSLALYALIKDRSNVGPCMKRCTITILPEGVPGSYGKI